MCHLAVGPRAHHKIVLEVSDWYRPNEINVIAEMFDPIEKYLRKSGQPTVLICGRFLAHHEYDEIEYITYCQYPASKLITHVGAY